MIGDGDCGEIGGMKLGRGNQKYSEKTCPSAIEPTCSFSNLSKDDIHHLFSNISHIKYPYDKTAQF
jgi:hypothetical protein